MKFDLKKSKEVLRNTPAVLENLLAGLSSEWIQNNEGEDSSSHYDVIGHLIHGEKTDWITRANIILEEGEDATFEAFDRFAQFEDSKGKSLEELLAEFRELREENLKLLDSMDLQEEQMQLKANHPALGVVKMSELLATWVCHDLNHIVQISRVMAKNYSSEVGPWSVYIGVLNS